MNKCILITGASSGIGQSLAEYYAGRSKVLILTGRDAERLNGVAKICETKGALVIAKVIDAADQGAMEAWILAVDSEYPVDLVIANAGVRAENDDLAPSRAETNRVLNINIHGVLNTVMPLIDRMKLRKGGQIAVVSSLAAYRTYVFRGAYSASKVAVKMFCESWRLELEPYNIAVSCICPGFVRSRLTAGHKHPMPFLMDADKAAVVIARGLEKKKAIIAFPAPVFMFMRMLQCLPVVVSDYIVRLAYKRELGG